MGFDTTLCRPRRAQTKGRVESGIKYVRGNFWPRTQFTDLDDLNRQAAVWVATTADVRDHGTTHERPVDRLAVERASLNPLPSLERLVTFLREDRTVGRDGYVPWDRSWYGESCQWAGLPKADRPAPREAVAVQLPIVDVERRSLAAYDEALGAAGR